MIYLFVFIFSIVSSYIGTITERRNLKKVSFIFHFMSVFVPAVLGGLRDLSIGTDVLFYVEPDFTYASQENDFSTFVQRTSYRDIGYTTICFICAQLFDSVSSVLFVLQFLTIGCFYIGFYKNKEICSLQMLLIIFFFMYYNDSYNLVRQYLAMGIIFMGINNILENNYRYFILYIITAQLFHFTASLGIVLIPIHYLLLNYTKFSNYIKIALFLLALLFGYFFKNVIELLLQYNLIPSRLIYYITLGGTSDNNAMIVFYLVLSALSFCFGKIYTNKIRSFNFFQIITLINFVGYQVAKDIYYGHRMILYFSSIDIIFLSNIWTIFSNHRVRIIFNVLLIALLFLYWYYMYVLNNVSQTFPYKSIFL